MAKYVKHVDTDSANFTPILNLLNMSTVFSHSLLSLVELFKCKKIK